MGREVRLTGDGGISTYHGSLLKSVAKFAECAELDASFSSMEEEKDERKQYYSDASSVPKGWYQAHHEGGGVILRRGKDISYLPGIVEQKKPCGLYQRDDLWDLPDGMDESRGAAWTKVASTFRTASLPFDDGGEAVSRYYVVHDDKKAATFHVRGGATERALTSAGFAHEWAVDALSKDPGKVVISTYDLSQKEPEWGVLDQSGMRELEGGLIEVTSA